jgi:hypothetical protein
MMTMRDRSDLVGELNALADERVDARVQDLLALRTQSSVRRIHITDELKDGSTFSSVIVGGSCEIFILRYLHSRAVRLSKTLHGSE